LTTRIATWEEMENPDEKKIPSLLEAVISLFKINNISEYES
jgi:hypothetical protein